MPVIDTLERKFGKFTFPFLLELLIAGQVMVFVAILTGTVDPDQLILRASDVFSGEVWRLFTFMVIPQTMSLLWFFIAMSILYLVGGALQNNWGEFRFSLYLGVNWLATILVSLLFPTLSVSNFYVFASLTVAFGRLFPNFEFMLMFVLPVKAKWFGYLTWALVGLAVLTKPLPYKFMAIAGVCSFFIFFGKELLFSVKEQKRTRDFQEKTKVDPGEAFHVCSRCGATDKTHPERSFRYRGDECICDVCLKAESES